MTPSCSPVDARMTRTSRARIRPFTRICGCRLNQSSWPAKREVNRHTVFISPHLFRASLRTNETLLPHHGCGYCGDGPALFASRLEDVGNIPSVARLIYQAGTHLRGVRLVFCQAAEKKEFD